MAKVVRSNRVARCTTVYVCDRSQEEGEDHCGQGFLLENLDGEGAMVLTCHHVIAPVKKDNLRVRIWQADGQLGEPLRVRYDEDRSRPERDAVVLRIIDEVIVDERPLLHKLDLDQYKGSLDATGITHIEPGMFAAKVKARALIRRRRVESTGDWPDWPDYYELQAFLLDDIKDARKGISGGVVFCEEGAIGLVHFAREESPRVTRQGLLVPWSVWAEGWPALEKLIEPLIDKNLGNAATIKRAHEVGLQRDDQLWIGRGSVIAKFRDDVYVERGVDARARTALERDGVMIVGRPKSGKTRLAWQLLQDWPEAVVVIPNPDSSKPPDNIELSGFVGTDLVILFDDLHSVAETMDPLLWRRRFEEAHVRSCLVIGTSRDGEDWERVYRHQRYFLTELGPDAMVFTSKVSIRGEKRGEDLSIEEGVHLAKQWELELAWEDVSRGFDGTLGWVLFDFEDMHQRYVDLEKMEREGVLMSRLLDSAKLLHEAQQPILKAPILRAVAEEICGSRISSEVWDALRRLTEQQGFGEFDDMDNFRIYRPYLEQSVTYEPRSEIIEQLLPILSKANDLEGLLYLGVCWITKFEDYEQALSCFEQATSLREDIPEAWSDKGLALAALGKQEDALEAQSYRHEEALEAFDRAISLREDFSVGWYNKANTLHYLGRYDEALEAFDRAINLTDDPEAWTNKGMTLMALGRYDEALEAFDTAIDLTNDPLAWSNKGMTLMALGKYEEALEAFDGAISLREDFSVGWYNKGFVLAKDFCMYDEALEAFDRAIDLRTGNYPEAWTNKGMTLMALGRYDEALEAFDTAIDLTNDPLAWYNKGLVLLTLGDYGETLGAQLGKYMEALKAFDISIVIRFGNSDAWYHKDLVSQRIARVLAAMAD